MTDATPEISFHTTLLAAGKTATGIEVPRELVERLGAGKKPAVRVTLREHSYRSTIAARVIDSWSGSAPRTARPPACGRATSWTS